MNKDSCQQWFSLYVNGANQGFGDIPKFSQEDLPVRNPKQLVVSEQGFLFRAKCTPCDSHMYAVRVSHICHVINTVIYWQQRPGQEIFCSEQIVHHVTTRFWVCVKPCVRHVIITVLYWRQRPGQEFFVKSRTCCWGNAIFFLSLLKTYF